jgi:hypothetical protein
MSIEKMLSLSVDGQFVFTLRNEKENAILVQIFNIK